MHDVAHVFCGLVSKNEICNSILGNITSRGPENTIGISNNILEYTTTRASFAGLASAAKSSNASRLTASTIKQKWNISGNSMLGCITSHAPFAGLASAAMSKTVLNDSCTAPPREVPSCTISSSSRPLYSTKSRPFARRTWRRGESRRREGGL